MLTNTSRNANTTKKIFTISNDLSGYWNTGLIISIYLVFDQMSVLYNGLKLCQI